MTNQNEIKKLLADGWVITDSSNNQMRKEIIKDKIYAFREDRFIDPVTKESVVFKDELDYEEFTWGELIDACKSFGYSEKQIDDWITTGEEIDLMLECIFELSK